MLEYQRLSRRITHEARVFKDLSSKAAHSGHGRLGVGGFPQVSKTPAAEVRYSVAEVCSPPGCFYFRCRVLQVVTVGG